MLVTRNVTIVLNEWLGEEVLEFEQIHWIGPHHPELGKIWSKLTLETRRRLVFSYVQEAESDQDSTALGQI